MPLQPSRRDTIAAPGRNLSSLSALVRHQGSALRQIEQGLMGGRFATPRPIPRGTGSQIVGEDDGADSSSSDEIYFIDTDQFVISGPGDRTFVLSHIPIDGSLHVRWVPLYVPSNNWSLSDDAVTVTDPGWADGDLVECAYAYIYDGEDEPSSTVVDFAASGWKWLQVPWHDTGDYHDPAFDDSAWATASGPFGQTTPAHTISVFHMSGWLDYVTLWQQGTQMWARRAITAEPGVDVTIKTRINRTVGIWWNGYYQGSTTAAELTWTIPGSQVSASNVLVCKAYDEGFTGPNTGCYFDAQVSQLLEEA